MLYKARGEDDDRLRFRQQVASVKHAWGAGGYVGLILAVLSGIASAAITMEDAWPVYTHGYSFTDQSQREREVFWPFWQDVQSATGSTTALRPLFVYDKDVSGEWDLVVLWPLFLARERQTKSFRQLLPIWHRERDEDEPGKSRQFLFPIYYRVRDAGEEPWLVVLPFYGRIRNRLARDEIKFYLFPLYMRTTRGEYVGTNILWPFYGRGVGPKQDYWRLWPLWGRREDKGRAVQSFYLWPLFHTIHDDLDRPRPGRTVYVIPLFGFRSSERSWMRSVLPPFFQFTESRDGVWGHYDMPWPIAQRAWSPGKRSWRVWPLYGRNTDPNRVTNYALWPCIWWGNRVDGHRVYRYRFLTPMWDERRWQVAERTVDHYIGGWPFFYWECDGTSAGRRRLVLLSPLPKRGFEGFHRLYEPFFAIVDCHRTDEEHQYVRFLWRVVEYQREGDVRFTRVFPFWSRRTGPAENTRWSLLTGLIGWERQFGPERERTVYRFLWGFRYTGAWKGQE